jgi:hypothetical protein
VDKIAVFVEGQGELIFVRKLLPLLIPYNILSLHCLSISADKPYTVFKLPNPNASFSFTIVNVGNDERVLTEIAEREGNLVDKGYCQIIALRDMYGAAYRKLTQNVDQEIINKFVRFHKDTIRDKMSNPEMISVFFAIMELEAWLLGMYNLFQKVNPSLTCDYIETELGFNLRNIDPQTEFFHPTVRIHEILNLIDEKYTKSKGQMESILSHLASEDISNAIERNRCRSLASFLDELKRLVKDK